MEETSKISPRLDEELKHELGSLTHGAGVDARTRDGYRDQVDLEPTPNRAERPDIPPPPGEKLSPHDAEQRAELARVITEVHFPTTRGPMVAAAEHNHAPGVLVNALRSLPDDRHYENVQAVWVALGGATET
jgi:hypothetical protein